MALEHLKSGQFWIQMCHKHRLHRVSKTAKKKCEISHWCFLSWLHAKMIIVWIVKHPKAACSLCSVWVPAMDELYTMCFFGLSCVYNEYSLTLIDLTTFRLTSYCERFVTYDYSVFFWNINLHCRHCTVSFQLPSCYKIKPIRKHWSLKMTLLGRCIFKTSQNSEYCSWKRALAVRHHVAEFNNSVL